MAHSLDGFRDGLPRAVRQGRNIGPARTMVGTGQRIQELSFGGVPAVCHQVNFQEPRSFFVPFRNGAYGNEGFEQAARFGGTQAMAGLDADRTQAAINAGRTDFQEQNFGVLGELDFLATFSGDFALAACFLEGGSHVCGGSQSQR